MKAKMEEKKRKKEMGEVFTFEQLTGQKGR